MRYCTLFLFSLLFAANAFGQNDSFELLPTRIVTTSNKIVKTTPPIVTVTYKDGSAPVGLHFRFQNVNQIANTQAGVLSVDGETPSILGARTEGKRAEGRTTSASEANRIPSKDCSHPRGHSYQGYG